MRQRCALARAFIVRPQVLLLDEPFGALDAMTRMTLQSVLKDLIEQERPTVLLVTHDVDEALYLADRVRKLVVPLLALTLASSAMAAEELRVGYGRAMDDAQVMLAQEAGLYEKYGLEAELLEFSSGTDLIKGIVGGQLDIGVLGFSNAFTWASRGADQKIVGGGPVAGRWPFGAAFLFEPYASIAKLQAPVEEIYEIGEVWPFPCMVVITSAETLENRRDVLWSAKNAQREAIDMLENDPALAATYIISYFVSGPVIETRDQGDSETVIEQAIRTNDFSAELTEADSDRMKELAVIMQEQDILQVEGEFDVNALLDLTWQEDREI